MGNSQDSNEPVAWMTVRLNVPIQTTARKDVADEWLKWGEVLPLYTAPPQRKPLAEWQINDLMADIDPEDRDSWSFRQGVYAAEKHHGVRK